MNDAAILGCLWGTAVGDALGLPYEGLSSRRAARMLGPPTRCRFFFRKGMVSDDTEHTILVSQALIESNGDVELFERSFASRLKLWFLQLPAGIGMATAKACCRLLIGIPPKKSGVYSAGNGPAMRSAILGVFARDTAELSALVKASTRLTHTDPKAEFGAYAIALAAFLARSRNSVNPVDYLTELETSLQSDGASDFLSLVRQATESVAIKESTQKFANQIGLGKGVGGYVFHCVPVVIHCWLLHQQDFRQAVETIVACGGDTDTNAAMVGGILGTQIGPEAIPAKWLNSIWLSPFSISYLRQIASQLVMVHDSRKPQRAISPNWCKTLVRNLFFLVVVLFHGFRRILPPY